MLKAHIFPQQYLKYLTIALFFFLFLRQFILTLIHPRFEPKRTLHNIIPPAKSSGEEIIKRCYLYLTLIVKTEGYIKIKINLEYG